MFQIVKQGTTDETHMLMFQTVNDSAEGKNNLSHAFELERCPLLKVLEREHMSVSLPFLIEISFGLQKV